MTFKRTNLTPVIKHLRQRLEEVGEAISTIERISEEYLEKKAPRASIRNPELVACFDQNRPEVNRREQRTKSNRNMG